MCLFNVFFYAECLTIFYLKLKSSFALFKNPTLSKCLCRMLVCIVRRIILLILYRSITINEYYAHITNWC